MKTIYKHLILLLFITWSTNLFATDYMVSGAGSAVVNGTYAPFGTNFIGNPVWKLSGGLYYLHSDGYSWVINDDSYYPSSSFYTNYNSSDPTTPPFTGWVLDYMGSGSAPTLGLPGPGVNYSSVIFTESSTNDGSINNSMPIVITHNNVGGGTFSGSDGDNFVNDGKILVSNLSAGLTAVIIRTSATTLSATITGNAASHKDANDVLTLTIAFQNSAFSGNVASSVSNAIKNDIAINYFQEYNIGSGGDYPSITAALTAFSSFNSDGDILNLAAQTFTEKDLNISNLTIRGQGAGSTIVQAAASQGVNNVGRVFLTKNTVVLEDLTVRYGNSHNGAGIRNEGLLTVNNCSITNNDAWVHGGGILNESESGSLVINNSTISNNTAAQYASGIALWAGNNVNCTMINCTVFGNTSGNEGALVSWNETNSFTIINSTISGNDAGLYSTYGGKFIVQNSIIAGNNSKDYRFFNSGTVTDNGNNIVESQTNFKFNNPTDILFSHDYLGNTQGISGLGWNKNSASISGNLNLSSSLADNGTIKGTQTLALSSGSFAVDAGTANGVSATDQRGLLRNGTTDIGAYEYGGTLTTTISSSLTLTQSILNGYTWPVIINGGTSVSPLIVTLGENVTLSNSQNYFIINGDYVTFEGNKKTITLASNVSYYSGLIQNGNSNANGFNNLTVQNLGVLSNNLSGFYAGWIGQEHFSKNASSNLVINCYSTGNINNYGGGIIGANSSGSAIQCYSTGNIGYNSGGIFGQNSSSCTANNCYAGGIYDNNDGIFGNNPTNETKTNCYAANGTFNTSTANANLTGTDGTVWNTIYNPFRLSVFFPITTISSSVTLTQSILNGYFWPVIINGGTSVSPLIVTLGENVTLSNSQNYFIINGDYVTFEGNKKTITLASNVSYYSGLIQNGNSNANGFNNLTVQNLGVLSNNLSGFYAGWIGQEHFSKNASSNLVINCYSTGNINNYGGGIIGANSSGSAIQCYSTGNIGYNSGGIFGQNSSSCTANNCYAGGIYDNNDGIFGNNPTNETKTNCYAANGTFNTTTANSNLTGTDGTIWNTNFNPFRLIVFFPLTTISSSVTLTQSVLDSYSWPVTINGGTSGSPLIVTLGEDVTLTNSQNYFVINGEYVTIDGNGKKITLSNITNYRGLVANGNYPENSWSSSFSNSIIKNIGVLSNNSSLKEYCGWIGQQGYGNGAGFSITYCYSNGNMTNDGSGGILGQAFMNGTISNCYSLGNISGNNTAGILAQRNREATKIINCYSNGSITGSNAGGICQIDVMMQMMNRSQFTNCYAANGTFNTTTANSKLTGTNGTVWNTSVAPYTLIGFNTIALKWGLSPNGQKTQDNTIQIDINGKKGTSSPVNENGKVN